MKFQENNTKLRVLLLEKVLLEHPEGLSMTEILSYLHRHFIKVERKTVYADLQALNYLYDVQYDRKKYRYILKRLPNDTFKEITINNG